MGEADRGDSTNAAVPPLDWFELANRQAIVARLVAGTVHEASNALQVISGAAEMLGLSATPQDVVRRTESIADHVTRATTALQELLAFVRDHTNARHPVSLRQIALAALAARHYALRRLEVRATVEGDDVTCLASRRALVQAVLNLVINAEQALVGVPQATLTLTTSSEGEMATLGVHDNGPGVAAGLHEIAGVWPPPSPSQSGTLGIGLRVTRAVLAREGGMLRLERATSMPGAAFTLCLPRVRD